MKYPTLAAFIFLFGATTEVSLAQSSPEAKPTPENSYTDVIDEESFASMLESSDKAKEIYEECKSSSAGGGILSCLQGKWKELTDEEKQELATALQNVTVTFKNGKQVFKKEEAKAIKLNPTSARITNANDPAVKKLREYLTEQLSNSLYGEMNQNKGQMTHLKLVDHSTFYKLFESQVGQNIILTLSDYCLNSKPVSVELPPNSDLEANGKIKIRVKKGNKEEDKDQDTLTVFVATSDEKEVESNLESLKKGFTGDAGAENKNSPYSKEMNKYKQCISRINLVCNPPLASWMEKRERVATATTGIIEETPIDSEQQNKACLVSEYLDRGRQALIDLDKIKETMGKTRAIGGIITENPQDKFYGDGRDKNEKSIQELTIHTSKEVEASGMQQVTETTAEKVDECIDSGGGEEECKNFLNTDVESKEKLLADEFFRSKAQEKRLEDKLKEDEKAVLTYLQQEGYDEESAKDIVDKVGNEKAIEKIVERYRNQKEAVISALNKEIEENTVGENDDKAEAARKVKSAIESRPKKLADLLQFSNLASSFIEVETTSAEGEQSRSSNSLAAFSELSSFNSSERSPSDESSASKTTLFNSQDDINKALEKLGDKKESADDDAGNATLTVDQINENLLKY